nr:unnamed protein product [Digitaria exilis]
MREPGVVALPFYSRCERLRGLASATPAGAVTGHAAGCPFGGLRALRELIRSGCSAAESAWGPYMRQLMPWPSDLHRTAG